MQPATHRDAIKNIGQRNQVHSDRDRCQVGQPGGGSFRPDLSFSTVKEGAVDEWTGTCDLSRVVRDAKNF